MKLGGILGYYDKVRMMWQVETEVSIKEEKETGNYYVMNQGDSIPVDIIFHTKKEAQEFADWLNYKDEWIEVLENVVEYEISNSKLEELKERYDKLKGWRIK